MVDYFCFAISYYVNDLNLKHFEKADI